MSNSSWERGQFIQWRYFAPVACQEEWPKETLLRPPVGEQRGAIQKISTGEFKAVEADHSTWRLHDLSGSQGGLLARSSCGEVTVSIAISFPRNNVIGSILYPLAFQALLAVYKTPPAGGPVLQGEGNSVDGVPRRLHCFCIYGGSMSERYRCGQLAGFAWLVNKLEEVRPESDYMYRGSGLYHRFCTNEVPASKGEEKTMETCRRMLKGHCGLFPRLRTLAAVVGSCRVSHRRFRLDGYICNILCT